MIKKYTAGQIADTYDRLRGIADPEFIALGDLLPMVEAIRKQSTSKYGIFEPDQFCGVCGGCNGCQDDCALAALEQALKGETK